MPLLPKIAVVGASARATAFSLLRAGCEVVAADLFADADLARDCSVTRITNYPDGLADWLAETHCDGWLYTGALENHPDLIDRMAKIRPLLGNKGDVLRTVRDPMQLHENFGRTWDKILPDVADRLHELRSLPGNLDLTKLQHAWDENRIRIPETKPCDGTHPGEGEWLHKTGQGGNGSGVTQLREPRGSSPRSSGFWQRYIPGTPGSAIYLGDGINTCTLLGITRQLIAEPWTGAQDFQYCGTLAPWKLPKACELELKKFGLALSTMTRIRGIFGIDFIFDGEHVWLIEVNPRVTAAVEVVERTTGNNLLAEHLTAFKVHSDPLLQIAKPAAGKVIVYAKHPLAVSRFLSERLLADAGPRHSPQLADIPNPDTPIAVGEPILTMLADGTDIATVESELRERVAALEHELYREL
jgi:predicted ATP-grasp superfamily ATP-dependent carboligase